MVPIFADTEGAQIGSFTLVTVSVADPDPNPDSPDPYVFGPPGSGSSYHHAKILRKTLIPTIL